MSASTGINISIDPSEKLQSLQALPVDQLPPLIRIGVVLNEGIFSNLSPPEDHKEKNTVGIRPGTSKVIHIDVGKKP